MIRWWDDFDLRLKARLVIVAVSRVRESWMKRPSSGECSGGVMGFVAPELRYAL